ncbi:MAG: hypothetical protein IVW53_01295 [Chloroflexi bacterium]|nr:hypothetical protein [Chloroflexota bacterium]
MFRPLDEVQADLQHLEDRCQTVVASAWADYAEQHRALRWQYNVPRVQAVLLHQYMENWARSLFVDEPSITMPPPGSQLFFLDYRHKYIIKPRKLNHDFTVANNSTRLALDFVEQDDGQLALDSMPEPVTNLHLGYLLNATRSAMISAHIVCPNGVAGYRWEWTLRAPDVGSEPIRLPAPDTGPRARPKEVEPPAAEERQDASGS